MRILIATHNPAKLIEIKNGLSELKNCNIQLLSLNDLDITSEPEETGKTFEENSLLKAKYYAKLSKLPTISDDGGLTIDYLNGAPGVKSRRWPGYDATDQELIDYTLLHLRSVTMADRTAYLQTCITFYDLKTKKYFQESEKVKGYIAEKAKIMDTNGFPYRAILIVNKFNKYYGELTEEEHEEINHRRKALKKIGSKIMKYLVQ
jgi:XTP/dITP diphosphohydrolase